MSSDCSKWDKLKFKNELIFDLFRVAAPLRMRTYCDGVKYSTPGAYEIIQDLMVREKNQVD